jgi:hypothetical protein
MTEDYPKYQRPDRKKLDISFFFDLTRAIMYIGVAIFLFSSNQFDGYFGHSFIVAFAVVAFIYGAFRLMRALYTIGFIKFR